MSRLRPRPWWVLAFFGVTLLAFGIGDVIAGPTADPAITVAVSGLTPDAVRAEEPVGYRLFDFATRGGGLNLIVIGVLLTAIVVGPYRARDRWAWSVLWVLPAWALATPVLFVAIGVAPNVPLAPPMVSGVIVGVVAGIALLIDRRRFGGDESAVAPPELAPA
jgi:hypothetical protein